MLLEGTLKSERADNELQAIATLGVSEEVLVTIAFPPKGVASKHSCFFFE